MRNSFELFKFFFLDVDFSRVIAFLIKAYKFIWLELSILKGYDIPNKRYRQIILKGDANKGTVSQFSQIDYDQSCDHV